MLNSFIKTAIGYVPGRLGYEIRRKQPESVDSVVARIPLATILDVGANVGQFALGMRAALRDAIIHSFEPIPSVEKQIKEAFLGDPRFFAYNVALSDTETTAQFQINRFSAASSLLPLGDAHLETFPDLTVVDSITVQVTTLDRWAADKHLAKPLLLKLDVQGNELAALRGGASVLARTDYVITEVCFAALYQGQPSFHELYQLLHTAGFEFIDLFPSKRDNKTLRCLFGDALFARR